MLDAPEDRPREISSEDDDPKLFFIINGERFPRPSLQTFFASPELDDDLKPRPNQNNCSCNPVGAYCSCNKVCGCNPVCGCVGHTARPSSGGSGYSYGCRCAPVH